MKKRSILYIFVILNFIACNKHEKVIDSKINILLNKFETSNQVSPFNLIKDEHYIPAFKEAINMHNSEIISIVNNTDEPTFKNTIEVFDTCGILLNRIESIFKAKIGTMYNYRRKQIIEEIFPLISKHRDSIYQNELLFRKVERVYENREDDNLTKEELFLLKTIYDKFVFSGAKLDFEKKEKLSKINAKLSSLNINFLNNLINDNKIFVFLLSDSIKLKGLPKEFVSKTKKLASNNRKKSKFQISLNNYNYTTILKYASSRKLREDIFKAYKNQANNNNDFDNKIIVEKITNLRLQKAKLFGYNNYSQFICVSQNRMLRSPEELVSFLNIEKEKYFNEIITDSKILQRLIKKEGYNYKLEPWDWFYYSEKYKEKLLNINDSDLLHYFELENTLNGLFIVINKLFKINIEERKDLPVFEKGIRTFEFKESAGNHLGFLYVSFYAGNTNTDYLKRQYYKNNKRVNPILLSNFNFVKDNLTGKTFLSLEQTKALYHEFGHVLHGLLSDSKYYTTTGLNVTFDFVEFPSQYLEQYALHKENLILYAKNYKTREQMPKELIEGINKYEEFDKAFMMSERIAAAYLDIEWHTITEEKKYDTEIFQKELFDKIKLPKEIIPRYMSTYFSQVFSGYYPSGYYSYIWTSLLVDKVFNKANIFDKQAALSFYNNILKKGGSSHANQLYSNFMETNKENIN